MNLLWIPPVLFGIVLLMIGGLALGSLRTRRAFQDAARELGLSWNGGGPFTPGELVGLYDHETVSVYTTKRGLGSLQRDLTIIEIAFDPPIASEFHLVRESVLDKLAHGVGLHDVELDDPAFDPVYQVKSAFPERLREVLNASTRTALIGIAKDADDVEVTPARLRWQLFGRLSDAHTIVRVVKQGNVVAKAMRHLNA